MKLLVSFFSLLFKVGLLLFTLSALAYAYDNYGRSYHKYVLISEDDRIG